jgi:hypothetical protein
MFQEGAKHDDAVDHEGLVQKRGAFRSEEDQSSAAHELRKFIAVSRENPPYLRPVFALRVVPRLGSPRFILASKSLIQIFWRL